jgi:hypothetical protein
MIKVRISIARNRVMLIFWKYRLQKGIKGTQPSYLVLLASKNSKNFRNLYLY